MRSRLVLAGSTALFASLLLASASFAQEAAAPAAPAASSAAPEAATPAAAAAPAEAAKPAAKSHYTDDYRINVNHDAKSDGEIVFRITPKEGEVTLVKVAIKNGTSENNVARAIRDAFKAQLGKKKFDVESEDGENVIIERKAGNQDYVLELASSSVQGVTITIHKD